MTTTPEERQIPQTGPLSSLTDDDDFSGEIQFLHYGGNRHLRKAFRIPIDLLHFNIRNGRYATVNGGDKGLFKKSAPVNAGEKQVFNFVESRERMLTNGKIMQKLRPYKLGRKPRFFSSRCFLNVDYRYNSGFVKHITYIIVSYKTVIRLIWIVRNPANDFPAGLLGGPAQAQRRGGNAGSESGGPTHRRHRLLLAVGGPPRGRPHKVPFV